MGMLDRSPLDSLRVLLRAASAIALTSPRTRDRMAKSCRLKAFISIFFISDSRILAVSSTAPRWVITYGEAPLEKLVASLSIVRGGYRTVKPATGNYLRANEFGPRERGPTTDSPTYCLLVQY